MQPRRVSRVVSTFLVLSAAYSASCKSAEHSAPPPERAPVAAPRAAAPAPESAREAVELVLAALERERSADAPIALEQMKAERRASGTVAPRAVLRMDLDVSSSTALAATQAYEHLFAALGALPSVVDSRSADTKDFADGRGIHVKGLEIALALAPERWSRTVPPNGADASAVESAIRAASVADDTQLGPLVIGASEAASETGVTEARRSVKPLKNEGAPLARIRQFLASVERANPTLNVTRINLARASSADAPSDKFQWNVEFVQRRTD
jgi:hypothetical protein